MKKIILTLSLLFISSIVFSQIKDGNMPLGKFEMKTITAAGETVPAEAVFGSKSFQIFAAGNKFKSIAENKNNEGTYKLDTEAKTLTVKVEVKGEYVEQTFKVIEVNEDSYTLEFSTKDGTIVLAYQKTN